MSVSSKQQAWADFWREDQAQGTGCLAGAASELGAIQSAIWQGFGGSLKRGAKVLDLGTGDGVVLSQMARRRSDLRLTGVDSAPFLPPATGKLRLRAGVAMEELPFPDGSFDAVVSQFGYEYGETRRSAGEVARVLPPGGRFLFLVHHTSGPIVAHNQRRAAAVRWVVKESGLLDKGRSLAAARRTMPLPTPASFGEAARDAARRFPQEGVAAEIAHAVLQSLALRPPDSIAALAEIERKAQGELLRLEALEAAARDEAGAAALAEELRSTGLHADDLEDVKTRSGLAFAWKLSGRA